MSILTPTRTSPGEANPPGSSPDLESQQTHLRSVLWRALSVVAIGLSVGALTSVLQTYLHSPWASLANAASPWLVPAFAVGALWRRWYAAAAAGLAVCGFELAGYYLTAAARGFAVAPAELWFWGSCAVLAGPVIAVAGLAWGRKAARFRGLGAAALVSAWLSEAIVSFGWRLHYGSVGIMFAAIGAALLIGLGFRDRQHRLIVRWLTVALPVGALAEILVDATQRHVY